MVKGHAIVSRIEKGVNAGCNGRQYLYNDAELIIQRISIKEL